MITMKMELVLILVFAILSGKASDEIEKKDLTWLAVDGTNADVTITNSNSKSTFISIDKSKAKPDCKFSILDEGSEFGVDINQPEDRNIADCIYSINFQVPKDGYPSIVLKAGTVKSKATLKQMRIAIEKGDIESIGDVNDLELTGKEISSTVSGSFKVLNVTSTKGKLLVNFTGLSSSGSKVILSGQESDIDLVFPKGTHLENLYNTHTSSMQVKASGLDLTVKTSGRQSVKTTN